MVRLLVRTFKIENDGNTLRWYRKDTNLSEKGSFMCILPPLRIIALAHWQIQAVDTYIQLRVHIKACLCVEIIRHKTQTNLARASAPISTPARVVVIIIIIMKQHRQPNSSSSSSRLATALLLTIALPYLLFSRCSADDSSSLIIDRRSTGLKEKQLQRRLKKLDKKRIRQSTLSNLLEPDAPMTEGFAIAAASA
eukprot:scaffold4525_cov75-Skeletonema_marinoi.AAC.5